MAAARARHALDPPLAVDRLAISFHVDSSRGPELLAPQSIRASERWVRHALQHGVKSFRLALTLKPWAKTWRTMDLAQIPSSSKLKTLRLVVDGTRVRLPSTVVFPSLTDLTLESMGLADDRDGRILAAFLSPACCPRLQKLRMRNVKLGSYLPVLIEASNLTELSLVNLDDMRSLELRTPGLRVLCIKDCHKLDMLTVIAPRLEQLTSRGNPSLEGVDGDLSCVSSINVDLSSHVEMEDGEQRDATVNDGSVLLLQRCSLAKSLGVDLCVPMRNESGDDIIKDKLPQLRHVTSLKVSVSSPCWRHSFIDGLASLLTTFKNLTYLSLFFKNDGIWSRPGNFNCGHLDHLKSQDISLINLHEAEFKGLTGTNCELQFLQFVLSSATKLQKVLVNFSPYYQLKKRRRNDFRHNMLLADGTWTEYNDGDQSYEWRPCR